MPVQGFGTACSGSFLVELLSRLSEIKTKEMELHPRRSCQLSKRRKRAVSREDSFKSHSRSDTHEARKSFTASRSSSRCV